MSFASGNIILNSDIINRFTASVINVIKSGAIDVNSVPTSAYYGRYVVNPSYLGNLSNIPSINSIGDRGEIIKAKNGASYNSGITYGSLYNAMVYITRYLLRIGTYSYAERYGQNSGYTNQWSRSGKAFFNDYALGLARAGTTTGRTSSGGSGSSITRPIGSSRGSLSGMCNINNDYVPSVPSRNESLNPEPPNDGGVSSGQMMSVAAINQLIQNCFNSWNNGYKPHCETINYKCHSNCHTDCHDNCHQECYSHENQTGYGSAAGGEGDVGCYINGCWLYGELYDQGYRCNDPVTSCHTNTGTPLSCHTDTSKLSIK